MSHLFTEFNCTCSICFRFHWAWADVLTSAGIFKQSMRARNRVGIGLSYRPARQHHCKKELAIFPSPAGMSLTKLSLAGKKLNYSRPGRVWSVTSRLETGKRLNLLYCAGGIESLKSILGLLNSLKFRALGWKGAFSVIVQCTEYI